MVLNDVVWSGVLRETILRFCMCMGDQPNQSDDESDLNNWEQW